MCACCGIARRVGDSLLDDVEYGVRRLDLDLTTGMAERARARETHMLGCVHVVKISRGDAMSSHFLQRLSRSLVLIGCCSVGNVDGILGSPGLLEPSV